MTFPNPRNAEDALRQVRIWERAQTLFTQQGYTAYHCGNDLWGVYPPDKAGYTVNLNAPTPTCTCPDFEEHRDYCKHTIGLQAKLEEEMWEEICAEYERTHEAPC